MSLLQDPRLMLVRTGPSLGQQAEQWLAGAYRLIVIARLRHFRERLEQDMDAEPWTMLQTPAVVVLHDVCEALGLDENEQASVLGQDGISALADILGDVVYPTPRPRLLVNERQLQAIRYLRGNGHLSLAIYRTLCPNWSDETLRLDLASLVRRGLLAKNGANRGTCYVLVEGDENDTGSVVRTGIHKAADG